MSKMADIDIECQEWEQYLRAHKAENCMTHRQLADLIVYGIHGWEPPASVTHVTSSHPGRCGSCNGKGYYIVPDATGECIDKEPCDCMDLAVRAPF